EVALDREAHSRQRPIARHQLPVWITCGAPPGPPHDAVGDPQPPEQRAPRPTVVSLVGVYALLVAADQAISHHALVGFGPGQQRLAHQARTQVNTEMRLVAEVIVAP